MATRSTTLTPRHMGHTGPTAVLITTPLRVPTACRARRTARTGPRRTQRRTTLIREHPRALLPPLRRTENRAWVRRITPTLARMVRLTKVPAQQRNGDNPTFLRETSPPPHNTTQRRMGPLLRLRAPRAGRPTALPLPMGILPRAKARMAI